MKKRIFVILCFCALCVLFCSCNFYIDGKSFDEDFLKSVSLQEMPLPTCERYALNSSVTGEETLKFETDLTDFEAYISTFIAYMNARDDIYYFGMQDGEGLIGEMLPHRVAYAIEGDFQWETGTYWYAFSYSLTDSIEESGNCEHKRYRDVIIVKFEYDKEDSIALIHITKNGALATECIDEALVSSSARG